MDHWVEAAPAHLRELTAVVESVELRGWWEAECRLVVLLEVVESMDPTGVGWVLVIQPEAQKVAADPPERSHRR